MLWLSEFRVSFRTIMFFLSIILSAYVFGGITVKYRLFPYDQASIVKHQFQKSKMPENIEVYDEKAIVDVAARRIYSTVENAIDMREQLKRNTIIPEYNLIYIKGNERERYLDSYINDNTTTFRSRMEVARVATYGVNHYGVLIQTSQKPNRKLLVYNQGHGGNPFKFEYFIAIIEEAKIAGYDVLALSMSGLGLNDNDPTIFPTRNGMTKFQNIKQHNIFSQFYDSKNPELTGLAPMLSGNYFLIKESIKRKAYKQVVMTGISGGGWYTTLLSSVIPEIERSISFAGTVPLGLRIVKRDLGGEHSLFVNESQTRAA